MTVSELAKLGGLARAKKLSKERKSEIAKKGAEARWGKGKEDGSIRERPKKVLDEGR